MGIDTIDKKESSNAKISFGSNYIGINFKRISKLWSQIISNNCEQGLFCGIIALRRPKISVKTLNNHCIAKGK